MKSNGRYEIKITITKMLHSQLYKEAKARGWPMARLIVHLCEASIEGIE